MSRKRIGQEKFEIEEENQKQICAGLGLEAFWNLIYRILYIIELKFKIRWALEPATSIFLQPVFF
jgi:hypothetical protein